MSIFNRLTALMVCAALLGPIAPLEARNRKGDKQVSQGRNFEAKKDWDAALEAYEKALAQDPTDIQYQMAVQRARFQAAQVHIEEGVKLRSQGQLGDALLQFQRGFSINPASSVAVQEIQTTQDMIERERQRVLQTGKESSPQERGMTPVERLKRDTDERLDRILPVPELKPLSPDQINLKINSTDRRVLYRSVAAAAGVNVLFDPDYAQRAPGAGASGSPQPLEFTNSTLEEALNFLAIVTKSYWKPLSSNTIFVTDDSRQKRTDYEDNVLKIFYVSNVQTPQELQEIITAARTLTDTQRMMAFNGQNAIIARGEADKIALAEKIIHDLDRPRAEVVIDVIVMETTSTYARDIATALAPTGLNIPINSTPRSGISITTPGTTTPGGTDTKGTTMIPLSHIGKVTEGDWSVTLPGALLQAVMSNANTKVLQSPQIRSVDNAKATVKIGDRIPFATGSFQPGIGGVGINPLVNTQFQYNDVGVNVEIQPRVHDTGEVTMLIDMDISSQNGTVNLGGIDQPIIGQRKLSGNIRLREGEVSLLGGLMKRQDTKTVTGTPGLSSIPLLRRLFTGESIDRSESELMIALVPHIIRRPELTAENLRTVSVGTSANTKLYYAPRAPQQPAEAAAAPATPATPAAPPAAVPTVPAAPPATAPAPAAATAPAPPPATAPEAAPRATAPSIAPPGPPAAAQPAGPVATRFVPASVETAASGAFSVQLVLTGGTDIASASPIEIRFDPKALTLTDITAGDLFSRDGQQPAFTRNIMNDMGLATIQFARPSGASGVSGPGTLATLRFQAVGRGTTIVNAPVTLRNPQGMLIGPATPQPLTVTIK